MKNYFQIEPADDERARRAKLMGQVLALDSVEAVLRWAAVGGPLPTDLSGLAFAQVRR